MPKRIKPKLYRMPSQPMELYSNIRHNVGQLGYFLPNNPTIFRDAALEYGEEELIYDVPRLVEGGELLNLGEDSGGSSILLAQGLVTRNLKGHVYTVDNFGKKLRNTAKQRYKEQGVNHLITIYNDTTDAVYEILKNDKRMFNFIFIDAGHSYENVKSDWLNYSNLVNPKGLIAFHDTNQTDTVKVIDEFIKPNEWTNIFWINRIKVFGRTSWVMN